MLQASFLFVVAIYNLVMYLKSEKDKEHYLTRVWICIAASMIIAAVK